MAPKRLHTQMLGSDSHDLRILVHSGEPIMAHREVLRLFSSCVRGLPDDMDWDLRAVQLEGKPIDRQTLNNWLEAVYGCIEPQEQRPKLTKMQLVQAYVFADFAGSSAGVMTALSTQLAEDDTLCTYAGSYPGACPPVWLVKLASTVAFHPKSLTIDSTRYMQSRYYGRTVYGFMDIIIAALEQTLYVALRLGMQHVEAKVSKYCRRRTGGGGQVYKKQTYSCSDAAVVPLGHVCHHLVSIMHPILHRL